MRKPGKSQPLPLLCSRKDANHSGIPKEMTEEESRRQTLHSMFGDHSVSTVTKQNGIVYTFDDDEDRVTAVLPDSDRREAEIRDGESVKDFFKRCSGILRSNAPRDLWGRGCSRPYRRSAISRHLRAGTRACRGCT